MPFFDLSRLKLPHGQQVGSQASPRTHADHSRVDTNQSPPRFLRPQTVPHHKVAPLSDLSSERPLTVGYGRKTRKKRKDPQNVFGDSKMPSLAGAHPLLLQEATMCDVDLVLKPLKFDHDQCLQLPRGIDRLWLLLPVGKRPPVEKLLHLASEMPGTSEDAAMAEAMSKAFFGTSGPGLLASLKNTAEARAACSPRTGQQLRRSQSPKLRDWQALPYMTKEIPKPAGTPGRVGAAIKRLSFSRSREKNPSTTPDLLKNCWADVCGAASMEMGGSYELSNRGGKLDLTQWWDPRVVSKDSARLDERGFALAALASQTRPAHVVLLAVNVSLENLRILSLWSRLQSLKLEDSDVMSVDGIEGCRSLQEASLIRCRCLRDVTPLGKCEDLKLIDLHACESLSKLGDNFEPSSGEVESSSGVFCLTNLRRIKLSGCRTLQINQLSPLYKNVRNIVFPDAKMATQCVCQLSSNRRKQFVEDAQKSALQWVQEAVEKVEPPVLCSWEKYIERMDEASTAIQYAATLGVSEGALQVPRQKRCRAKLILHLGHKLTPEENSVLRLRSGRKGIARMRRCLHLIKYMKIRRLDGVTRNDFCAVLGPALQESKDRLCRVYNFMDVEREEILTQEDFARLSEYNGPAATGTVDNFRLWAYSAFGGLEKLFLAITHQAGSINDETGETVIDYHPFCKALLKLGWKGMPAEIFALLNDHKPKTPYIKLSDFVCIDWLYLSQVSKFQARIVERYGSVPEAFKAIDGNNSKVISFTEFRKWIINERVLDGIGSEDCERFLTWMDVNDNQSITAKEFDALSSLDVAKFQSDLCRLRELILEKWITYRKAFLSMSEIKVPPAKVKLGKAAKKARKAGVQFVHYEQFRQGMESLGFKPVYDLHLLFRYLDYDMQGTLTLDDFMVLPVITIADTRECFAKVKAYLLDHWGSFEESFSGLSRAAQQIQAEGKGIDGSNEEGSEEKNSVVAADTSQKPGSGSKAPKAAPKKKK